MDQPKWHFCENCSVMFFGGDNVDGGVCIRGGTHIAQGFEFTLPFSDAPPPEAPNTQANWGFCHKCGSLAFVPVDDGNVLPGVCVRGGYHDLTGSFNFHLPHDIPEAPSTQQNWRFCRKCGLMFFGGNPGRCVKGGGHDGTGSFNFVLQHGSDFIPKRTPFDDWS